MALVFSVLKVFDSFSRVVLHFSNNNCVQDLIRMCSTSIIRRMIQTSKQTKFKLKIFSKSTIIKFKCVNRTFSLRILCCNVIQNNKRLNQILEKFSSLTWNVFYIAFFITLVICNVFQVSIVIQQRSIYAEYAVFYMTCKHCKSN